MFCFLCVLCVYKVIVNVGFVVGKMAPGQVFLKYFGFPWQFSFPQMPHSLICHLGLVQYQVIHSHPSIRKKYRVIQESAKLCGYINQVILSKETSY
jgi:hypothetical protein